MNLSSIYIIKTLAFGETSNIYEIISNEQGRMSIIHKGAKKGKKSFPLNQFCPYKISWAGKSSLKYLKDYENINNKINLSDKHKVIALYLNELLFLLVPRDLKIDGLFDVYDEALYSLVNDNNLLKTLNNYEITILEKCGHSIFLKSNLDNISINSEKKYLYISDYGPKETDNNDGISGKTFLALANEIDYDKETLIESRNLMKKVIDFYIKPKTIKTREIFKYIALDSDDKKND
tara:strand:+ start:693 stop:1397 length:705 start_codon:yes stop_codon:yes gene_type:complete